MRVFLKQDSWYPLIAGINGLSYSSNDPVNYFDPSGHITQKQMQTDQNKYHMEYARMGDVGVGWIVAGIAAELVTTALVTSLAGPLGIEIAGQLASDALTMFNYSSNVSIITSAVAGAAGAVANDAVVDAGQGVNFAAQMHNGGWVDVGMGALLGGASNINTQFLKISRVREVLLQHVLPVAAAPATQGIDIMFGYQKSFDIKGLFISAGIGLLAHGYGDLAMTVARNRAGSAFYRWRSEYRWMEPSESYLSHDTHDTHGSGHASFIDDVPLDQSIYSNESVGVHETNSMMGAHDQRFRSEEARSLDHSKDPGSFDGDSQGTMFLDSISSIDGQLLKSDGRVGD